ncbi:MAG TPA: tRNA preQ1(34) S-adenosylmethionine ribosyltransferase-isomerase QueA [Dissulfurispiraceae bacterium]|nr:tRNA preQ1(34) S-adenosylmethionine ribosyltransferase-isomerase QueA [Dissulfurispiraceae bacterium]
MKTADFDFYLPQNIIAFRPSPERDGSRMLVVQRDGTLEHRLFKDISKYFVSGDLLILNNTKVMPVRLIGKKPSGGRIDLILVKGDGAGAWEILCRGRYVGLVSFRSGIKAEIFEISLNGGNSRRLRFVNDGISDISEILALCGAMPLPPYIRRMPDEDDMLRYQTIYAEKSGSIAAPTAGLHFTEDVLQDLKAKGVLVRRLTLHVGAGTFIPIKTERVHDHEMQAEYFEIGKSVLDEIRGVKKSGGKIVAVGTTAARALEGYLSGRYSPSVGSNGVVRGSTDIFIYPGYQFKAIDALLTNFHLPQSTPLMLASALCGYNKLMVAYREAIAKGYRFFSYGDAMLIL